MTKLFKYLILLLAVTVVITLVMDFPRRAYPMMSPVFWVSVALEVALAYLAYSYWVRSMAGIKYRNYRFWAIIIVVIGLTWPFILTYFLSNIEILKLADKTGYFFIASILCLASFYFFKDNYIRFFELFRRK
jgi:hypothetical protein